MDIGRSQTHHSTKRATGRVIQPSVDYFPLTPALNVRLRFRIALTAYHALGDPDGALAPAFALASELAGVFGVRWQWMSILVSGRTRCDGVTRWTDAVGGSRRRLGSDAGLSALASILRFWLGLKSVRWQRQPKTATALVSPLNRDTKTQIARGCRCPTWCVELLLGPLASADALGRQFADRETVNCLSAVLLALWSADFLRFRSKCRLGGWFHSIGVDFRGDWNMVRAEVSRRRASVLEYPPGHSFRIVCFAITTLQCLCRLPCTSLLAAVSALGRQLGVDLECWSLPRSQTSTSRALSSSASGTESDFRVSVSARVA